MFVGLSSSSSQLEMFSSWIVSDIKNLFISLLGEESLSSVEKPLFPKEKKPLLDKSILVRLSLITVTAIFLLLRSF